MELGIVPKVLGGDALRPPGEPVNGCQMSDDAYISRPVDWIVNQDESNTAAEMISAADSTRFQRAGQRGRYSRVTSSRRRLGDSKARR